MILSSSTKNLRNVTASKMKQSSGEVGYQFEGFAFKAVMAGYNKIKDFECPFNWKLNEIQHRRNAESIIEKLNEKYEELVQPWSSLCLSLTNSYLYYELGDNAKCAQLMKECEQLLRTTKDPVIIKYKLAFSSVLNGSRAVFAFKNSATSEAKEFVEKVTSYSMLNKDQQSAVLTLKSNVFVEFGVEGTKAALVMSKEAVSLNPVESDWHFQLGKILSRIRHCEAVYEPSSEEIIHFQKAYSLSPTARAAAFLGNAYRERANYTHIALINGTVGQEMKDRMAQYVFQAKSLLLTALDLDKDDDVHILIRCAYGLSKLPYYSRDLKKAKELVKLALEKSPLNAMGHGLAGAICMKEIPPEQEKALDHYHVAASKGVFSAHLKIFDIKISLGVNPDPEEFYQHLQAKFPEVEFKKQILLHAVNYYLFIKKDLLKALDYFFMLIELDPANVKLKEDPVMYLKKTINLFELLANEIRCAVNCHLFKDEDEVKQLKKAMEVIKEHAPEVMRMPVQINKITELFNKFNQEEKEKQERYVRNRNNKATLKYRELGRVRGGVSEDQSDRSPRQNWRSSVPNRQTEQGHQLGASVANREEAANLLYGNNKATLRYRELGSVRGGVSEDQSDRSPRQNWRSSVPNRQTERDQLGASVANREEAANLLYGNNKATLRYRELGSVRGGVSEDQSDRSPRQNWRSSVPNREEAANLLYGKLHNQDRTAP